MINEALKLIYLQGIKIFIDSIVRQNAKYNLILLYKVLRFFWKLYRGLIKTIIFISLRCWDVFRLRFALFITKSLDVQGTAVCKS